MVQTTLFGRGEIRLGDLGRAQRLDLGCGAWVEHHQGLLEGQDHLFAELRRRTGWTAQKRPMYERVVEVPRLLGRPPRLAVLGELERALHCRYGWTLNRVSAALYRDGRDSVAWHGDRMGALREDCVIAVLSLGSPRRFLLRPTGGGPSRALPLRGGDLVVMGGTAQSTWEHCVPKCADAGPRIAVMFRPSRAPVS